MARFTKEQINAGLQAAAERAATESGAGTATVTDAAGKMSKVFDDAHAAREALKSKALKKQLALDLKAAQKSTKIGLGERIATLGFREAVGKPALIGTGIVAAAGVLGVLAMKLRGDRKKASKAEAMMEPAMDPMAAMPAPMDMSMMGQNTMMGMEPVEGPKAQAIKDQRAAAMGAPQVGM